MCPQTCPHSSLCGCDPGHGHTFKQNHILLSFFLLLCCTSLCSVPLARFLVSHQVAVAICLSLAQFAVVSLLPSSMPQTPTLSHFLFHTMCLYSICLSLTHFNPLGQLAFCCKGLPGSLQAAQQHCRVLPLGVSSTPTA